MNKFISFLLVLCLTFSICVPAYATTTTDRGADMNNCMTLEEIDQYHNEVRELQSQRSLLSMQKYMAESNGNILLCSSNTIDTIDARINEIDDNLLNLGVQQVALSELGFVGQARNLEIPDTPNERWELEKYTVYFSGKRYEVSVLTATSKNYNSKLLAKEAAIYLHAAPGLAAGTADYIRIYATAVSGIVGTVAGSIYDAIHTTISNLSTSTIIHNVSATYQWQCDTIMHYAYVKEINSVGEPLHCYTYNEVNTLVAGLSDDIDFSQSGMDKLNFETYWLPLPNVMEPGANRVSNAVDCFLNYAGIMHSFVGYVDITGIGGKKITRHYVWQRPEIGFLLT